ncbi:hypothetical protein [Geothrix campi]|uniref:hypothetical protein n=1 Tax=Geothrix campi TaxID=2966450 RepID=UPI002147FC4D|nr:hypothetical protein [Geothrix sp. SG10]
MIENALRAAGRIPQDKLLHAVCGALLALLGLAWGPVTALLLPTALGVAKEVYDHFNPPHVADPMDLLATILGVVPVLAAYAVGVGHV